MAEKTGFYSTSGFTLYSTEYLSSDTYSGGTNSGNDALSVGSNIVGSQPYVNNLPVSVRSWGINSFHSNYYYKDYYDRIHINPSSIDLGNLLGSVSNEYRIWNSYTSSKTVTAVTYTDVDGISINSDKTLPGVFAPMEEATFTVLAELSGPPTVDASIYYDFAVGANDVELTLTGRRVVVWPFMPQTKVRERLEWKTSILPSYDKEQRHALRIAPRQSFAYEFMCSPSQFSRMKAAAFQWSHRLYGVPVWYEAVKSANLSAGTATINVDTRYSDFVVGSYALIWSSDTANEVAEILSKTTTSITIKRSLTASYTSPLVVPVQLGFTPNGVQFQRTASELTIANAEFEVTGNTLVSLTYSPTTYKGYYVVTDRTLILGGVDESIARELDVIDNETGARVLDSTSNIGIRRGVATATAKTIAERWKVRSWFHSLKGKQKAFWMSTWNKDMELSTLLLNSSYSMEIYNIGFTLFLETGDFVIKLKTGQIYYNRILGSEVLVDGTERLAIETLFPVNIDPVDVESISFLHLVRLDSDAIDLDYDSGVLEVSVPTRGVVL